MIKTSNATDAQQYWKATKLEWNQQLRSGARSMLLRLLGNMPGLPVAARTEALGILMYHRVTPKPKGLADPTWNVAPERFEQQLRGLLRRGFCPLRLSQLIDAHGDAKRLPSKSFVVTFDDGYDCIYQYAFPILKRLQIPATIFLATAYLDQSGPLPFDDWTAAGSSQAPSTSWRPLSSAQCDRMADSGLIDLGAHTHTHLDFRGRHDELLEDLQMCVETLQIRFGIKKPTFAFPYGSRRLGFVDAQMLQAAAAAGASCALTTEPEMVRLNASPFGWGRFNVDAADGAAILASQLLGWRCLLRRLRTRGLSHPPTMSTQGTCLYDS